MRNLPTRMRPMRLAFMSPRPPSIDLRAKSFIVHDVADIECGLSWANNRTHYVVGQKIIELGYNIRNQCLQATLPPPAFSATSRQNWMTRGFLQVASFDSRNALFERTRDTSTSIVAGRIIYGKENKHFEYCSKHWPAAVFISKSLFKDREHLVDHKSFWSGKRTSYSSMFNPIGRAV